MVTKTIEEIEALRQDNSESLHSVMDSVNQLEKLVPDITKIIDQNLSPLRKKNGIINGEKVIITQLKNKDIQIKYADIKKADDFYDSIR